MFKPFDTTAIFKKNGFKHFHIYKEICSLYGDKPEDIVNVEISIHEDQTPVKPNSEKDSSNPDYWGFFDNKENKMYHIYPAYFLFKYVFSFRNKGIRRKR